MIKSDKKWYLFGGVVLVLAVSIVGVSMLSADKNTSPSAHLDQTTTEPELKSTFNWINGLPAEPGLDSDLAKRRMLAVMVENHPDARPQAGLSEAELVFEVVAEGGITRYLAFFQQENIEVGPVRSARPYFAELANQWPSLYLHVGGSPEVLQNIQAKKYKNLVDFNEYYNGKYFTRVKSRSAPHNVYTNTKDVFEYLHNSSLDLVTDPVVFNAEFSENVLGGIPEQSFEVNFSKPQFLVGFTYDSAQKKYLRSLAGKADVDAGNGEQVAPISILVLETAVKEIVGDSEGRMEVETLGSGKLTYHTAGQKFSGFWKRESGKPFEFTDSLGNPIKLLPGQVWMAVVESASE